MHDVVFVVIGGGDDFLRDTERGADFAASDFAVFEELEIGGGEFGLDDLGGAPEQNCFVG